MGPGGGEHCHFSMYLEHDDAVSGFLVVVAVEILGNEEVDVDALGHLGPLENFPLKKSVLSHFFKHIPL